MPTPPAPRYVSRAGDKLEAAITGLGLEVTGLICADLGSHVGGFVDCLLAHGADKVYSVDTSYGTLAWKLRKDPRVVVQERSNAMHVILPEQVQLVTIDVGWTRQEKVLPNVARMLAPAGQVVSLIKPHYEAPRNALIGGVLPEQDYADVTRNVLERIEALGWTVLDTVDSPIQGHGGNRELLARLTR